MLKKTRTTYLYMSLFVLFFTIISFLLTYYMVKNIIEKPDILHYYRGSGVGILAAILFAIITASGGYCFIKNRPLPIHIDYKISKFVGYYGSFIILMIPVSGFVITNKIISDGYIRCESRPYSITYAKTEQACKQYKNRRHPYRKYEDQ